MTKRRLYQELAEQIIELIRQGTFPPGSRLPGERELAERFGASRVAIREAEISLEAKGWLQIKGGSGAHICGRPEKSANELPSVSAFELTEARALFESEAAALAAPIISNAALDRLDALIATMSKEGDEESTNEADQEFHMTIASASGNAAIIHTVETFWRMRKELPEVRAAHQAVCKKDGASRHDEHQAILDALKARDPHAARRAMRLHFGRLLAAMLDATEERAMRELRQRAMESRERFLISTRIG